MPNPDAAKFLGKTVIKVGDYVEVSKDIWQNIAGKRGYVLSINSAGNIATIGSFPATSSLDDFTVDVSWLRLINPPTHAPASPVDVFSATTTENGIIRVSCIDGKHELWYHGEHAWSEGDGNISLWRSRVEELKASVANRDELYRKLGARVSKLVERERELLKLLEGAQARVDELVKEVETLRNDGVHAGKAIDEYQQRIESLQFNAKAFKEAHRSIVDELNGQIDKITRQGDKLVVDIENRDTEIANLKRRQQDLISRVGSVEARNAALAASVVYLEKRNAGLSMNMEAYSDNMYARLQALTAERDVLRDRLDFITSNRDSLHIQASSLMAQRDDLLGIEKQMEESLAASESAYSTVCQRRDAMATERQALEEQVNNLSQALSTLADKYTSALSHWAGERAIRKQRAIAKQKLVVSLRATIKTCGDYINDLFEENMNLRKSVDTTCEGNEILIARVVELQRERDLLLSKCEFHARRANCTEQ